MSPAKSKILNSAREVGLFDWGTMLLSGRDVFQALCTAAKLARAKWDGVDRAKYAIDRNLETQAVTKAINGNSWIKLEFDKTYFVRKVLLYALLNRSIHKF